MGRNVKKTVCVAMLWLTAASCLPQSARAEEPTAMGGGPVLYLAAAALALNAGATVANGAALVAGKPNRGNGMFGVVLGSATLAAAAAGFAFADGDTDSETFSAVLAGLGLASLLTGYLNVRAADGRPSGPPSTVGQAGEYGPRLVVGPRGAGRSCGWVAAVQVGF